jgi:hypothetical protein
LLLLPTSTKKFNLTVFIASKIFDPELCYFCPLQQKKFNLTVFVASKIFAPEFCYFCHFIKKFQLDGFCRLKKSSTGYARIGFNIFFEVRLQNPRKKEDIGAQTSIIH